MSSIFQEIISDAIATLERTRQLESELRMAADKVVTALLAGNKVLLCGNGGSAAEASHLGTELLCRFKDDRRPYAAVSLNENGALLTALANDYPFEEVFARQVEGLGREGDVLVVFSTSGNSHNVLRAVKKAGELGMVTIGFLGRDGGHLKGRSDVELLVASEVTARIQEAHQLLLHALCVLIEEVLEAQ